MALLSQGRRPCRGYVSLNLEGLIESNDLI